MSSISMRPVSDKYNGLCVPAGLYDHVVDVEAGGQTQVAAQQPALALVAAAGLQPLGERGLSSCG